MSRPDDDVLAAVRSALPRLRASERKVADVLMAAPERIMAAPIAEAARLAGVSQPTVLRFVHAIGCPGYRDFRLRLAGSLARGGSAAHSAVHAEDPPAAVAEKLFAHSVASLERARARLDGGALARAVDLLAAAEAIVFFGFGASAIVARDAQQKFPLFGVPCVAEHDAHQQLMAAAMMRPGEAAVVISNTGASAPVLQAARAAKAAGAAVLGLVGRPSPLGEACDVTLLVDL